MPSPAPTPVPTPSPSNMIMLGPQPDKIADGALVIIYERHDSLSYL
jgi:hypothetical protein